MCTEHTLPALLSHEIPNLKKILARRVRSQSELDDVLQNALLEICRVFPRYRQEGSVGAFMCGIAIRVARRARRSNRDARASLELELEPAADGPSPEDHAISRERVRRLEKKLTRLSQDKRRAFLLWALEGKAPEEIAQLTDASIAATRSRIFYAQKELKKSALHDPYLREYLAAA